MLQECPVPVKRLPVRLEPDPSRVIPRFFGSADTARTRRTIERVMKLTEEEASDILVKLRQDFEPQHKSIADVWAEHFERVRDCLPDSSALSEQRQLLIGAYFTMEYAIEAAALFNPSMVAKRDQTGLAPGSTRFIMSLRATGEGHVSSIVFRVGVIDSDCNICLEPPSPVSRPLRVVEDAEYEKAVATQLLTETGAMTPLAERVLAGLGDRFTKDQLSSQVERVRDSSEEGTTREEQAENLLWLVRSHYRLVLPDDAEPAELVIFPTSENESRGIEDLRLVRFTNDDGSVRFLGTYTAYNGFKILPTMMEATDFRTIKMAPLHGRYARNKGMALFPRKIHGKYMMSGRLDGENLYILESDTVHTWNHGKLVQTPKYWWEMAIIGNCGSPMETEEGWLLLTHGVGPMRQYCIGATLLDLDDPSRVIGQTEHPLIVPTGDERIGYVPNVVYSCGGMIHSNVLIIPYAMSDVITTFASVPLPELLDYIKGSSA